MDAFECLFTRRSVREYNGEAVSEEKVAQILEAAMLAPSAGDARPWQFVLLRDKEMIPALLALHPHANMLENAGLGILVCGDLRFEQFKGFWVQDCSAAAQNILLASRALGLGSVWLAIYPIEERVKGFQQLLNLPEEVIPLALIPVGHPIAEQGKEERFNAERVHVNQW